MAHAMVPSPDILGFPLTWNEKILPNFLLPDILSGKNLSLRWAFEFFVWLVRWIRQISDTVRGYSQVQFLVSLKVKEGDNQVHKSEVEQVIYFSKNIVTS